MEKLKLGVIGLGEIAQIAHLPVLEEMPDKFQQVAFCDISEELLNFMGKKYRVDRLYTNALQMFDNEELDAVFILSGILNAAYTIEAAKRRIHVFVEKPMAMTLSQVDDIIRAKNDAGVHVMVGYMRRFAPAFMQAIEEIKNMKAIKYVKVRDFIGQNSFFTTQSKRIIKFDDIPAEAKNNNILERSRLLDEATGKASPQIKSLYGLLTGLSTHSTSAMRELFGMPERVEYATCWNNTYFNAIFDYGKFKAVYEMFIDLQRRFDADIEIYGEDRTIKIQYDTPYLRNLPVRLVIGETVGEGYSERVIRPTYRDPFSIEIESFYNSITQNIAPKTSPDDFKSDLELFQMILKSITVG